MRQDAFTITTTITAEDAQCHKLSASICPPDCFPPPPLSPLPPSPHPPFTQLVLFVFHIFLVCLAYQRMFGMLLNTILQ